jgi:FKBP-type peptidyl-prolyl cis-trans isomerase SlyD
MKVAKGSAVELDYTLHLGDGEIVDRSEPGEPLTYLHGESQIVPGLEAALEGLEAGASRQVIVPPTEGYGERDPRGIQEVPRAQFPPQVPLQPGTEMLARGEDGEVIPLVIVSAGLETVTVDLNHPLAGKTLHFDVTVRSVREATAEELEHGHVHGEGGHEH